MSASSMVSLTMWYATALRDGSGRGQHDAVAAVVLEVDVLVSADP